VAGIQNKVLDAATLGLPQVVTPAALEGFAPGMPLAGQVDDPAFAAELVRLLEDAPAAAAEASALRAHVEREYGTERWRAWAESVLA
jgi:hypothetical protein